MNRTGRQWLTDNAIGSQIVETYTAGCAQQQESYTDPGKVFSTYMEYLFHRNGEHIPVAGIRKLQFRNQAQEA
ncbi:hypothetical protein BaRGS_00032804, partial [Batillaria attramentaria]